jgi:hypothetical protein
MNLVRSLLPGMPLRVLFNIMLDRASLVYSSQMLAQQG